MIEACSAVVTLSEPVAGDLDAVLAATEKHGVPGVFARPEDGAYPSYEDAPWLVIPHGEARPSWTRSLSPPPVVTNEAKVLFPRDGFTKKDVVGYYDGVADVMLPHLRDRPIVAQRWPDGIDEFTWYQHRVPPNAPDYLLGVWIEGNRRILLPDRGALLWMVNQAALTLHGWSSRVGGLSEPDWVTLDLDPGESTRWEDVIEVAIAVRKLLEILELLELLELPSVPKTSGPRGLPGAPRPRADRARSHARAGQRARAWRRADDRASATREGDARDARRKAPGRLFLDVAQSSHHARASLATLAGSLS